MGCAEKLRENRKKTEWKSLDTRQRARCNSYFILFNFCGSPGFYHLCQNQISQVRLFISTLLAEKKVHFRVVLYKIGKKLSPWKMKSPGILFSRFSTNPVLTLCFACWRWVVLSLNCFVPIHTTIMLTVCYINRQPDGGYHYSDTNACSESAASKKEQNGQFLARSCPIRWSSPIRWIHGPAQGIIFAPHHDRFFPVNSRSLRKFTYRLPAWDGWTC